MIKVSVVGAKGRMGSHVVEAVNNAEDTQLALALDAGDDLTQITTDNTDVVVEFTVPSVSLNNVLTLIGQGVDVVVGTTGWTDEKLAQVKSAILLAGLYCDGTTSVTEPVLSRNHTELMLSGFGANVTSSGRTASIEGNPHLVGQKIQIPGDISSAAYFIAAASIVPNAELMIYNVNCNPTRDGILKVAEQMGADITYENRRKVSGEEVCDLIVRSSSLHGTTIEGDLIPTLIDEIPVIAVMAAFAEGDTIIRDAKELRVKESDRVTSVVENLNAMGADAIGTEDGMIIHGGRSMHGTQIKTYADHRIAMSFAIAGLAADGVTTFDDPDCVVISYPNFYDTLQKISS